MSDWGFFASCEKLDQCRLDESCDLYELCAELVEVALDPPAETPPEGW